jgi:hypothetical protein
MKKLGFPIILCLLLTFFLPLPALAADPIAILPSGDATGQTDADALQAALTDAAPGRTPTGRRNLLSQPCSLS